MRQRRLHVTNRRFGAVKLGRQKIIIGPSFNTVYQRDKYSLITSRKDQYKLLYTTWFRRRAMLTCIHTFINIYIAYLSKWYQTHCLLKIAEVYRWNGLQDRNQDQNHLSGGSDGRSEEWNKICIKWSHWCAAMVDNNQRWLKICKIIFNTVIILLLIIV